MSNLNSNTSATPLQPQHHLQHGIQQQHQHLAAPVRSLEHLNNMSGQSEQFNASSLPPLLMQPLLQQQQQQQSQHPQMPSTSSQRLSSFINGLPFAGSGNRQQQQMAAAPLPAPMGQQVNASAANPSSPQQQALLAASLFDPNFARHLTALGCLYGSMDLAGFSAISQMLQSLATNELLQQTASAAAVASGSMPTPVHEQPTQSPVSVPQVPVAPNSWPQLLASHLFQQQQQQEVANQLQQDPAAHLLHQRRLSEVMQLAQSGTTGKTAPTAKQQQSVSAGQVRSMSDATADDILRHQTNTTSDPRATSQQQQRSERESSSRLISSIKQPGSTCASRTALPDTKADNSNSNQSASTALSSLSNFVSQSLGPLVAGSDCAPSVNNNKHSELSINTNHRSRVEQKLSHHVNNRPNSTGGNSSADGRASRNRSPNGSNNNNNNSHNNHSPALSATGTPANASSSSQIAAALKNSPVTPAINTSLAKVPPELVQKQPAWVFCTRYSDRPSSGKCSRVQYKCVSVDRRRERGGGREYFQSE